MPNLRSHTHLQATQSSPQSKACKRVCLSNRTNDRQLDDRKEQRRHSSTFAIGRVSSPLDSFVVAESSVLLTNFCGEKPTKAKLQTVCVLNDHCEAVVSAVQKMEDSFELSEL
jgi:hypothetical protein